MPIFDPQKDKLEVIWYCHKYHHQWKGVRFRKQWGRGGRRVSRSLCPKCGSRMVTPGYGSESWPEIRRKVWIRDKFQCRCCGIHGKKGGKLLVHHKRPVKEGGSSHIDNLILLCEDCHKWEHRMLTWIGSGAKYSSKSDFKPWGIIKYLAFTLILLPFPILQFFAVIPFLLGLYALNIYLGYQKHLKRGLPLIFKTK